MSNEFPRILLSLRKEHKLTQKQAAKDMGVSPALLSHYEKGVRECGLQFVVRAADYYHVSCDYLLGRTTDRSGMSPELVSPRSRPTENERPLEFSSPEDVQQRQILQSVHILFRLLHSCGHAQLTEEATRALSVLLYSLFRGMCAKGDRTSDTLFSFPETPFYPLSTAAISRSVARVASLAQGFSVQDQPGLPDGATPFLSEDLLRRDFPFFASSLSRLFQDAEKALQEAE